MKKLFITLVSILFLVGCEIELNDYVIVRSVHRTPDACITKYSYDFENYHYDDVSLYSDSLYSVGDTLYLIKK